MFSTQDDAALDAARYARSFTNQKIEYGGWVYPVGDCWTYNFLEGTENSLPPKELEESRPDNSRDIWHTHPNTGDPSRRSDEESFSGNVSGTTPGDMTSARTHNLGVYLNTPRGYNGYYDYYQDPKIRHLPDKEPETCKCK